MPLNKLENFLKNVEGRILYVSPADLDSTDSILNQGNSQTKPFKTLQRALIEAARFSYNVGRNNDTTEKTTILLMPGEHEVDNRPGFGIEDDNGVFKFRTPAGDLIDNSDLLSLKLESNFDLNQEDNILYKFNSVNGGVIVPRGTSIVGLDLRKTKIKPKYVPNPTDDSVPYSSIFRITGACYFWQFSIFDGNDLGKVYTDNKVFNDTINQVQPTFSHHKLTCFEYADGVNDVGSTGLTDLDMYYYKLSRAYNAASNRNIQEKFLVDGSGTGLDGFAKQRPEWEIVGAFASDPIKITKIQSGSLPGVPTNQITVTTQGAHNLSVGTPIKIKGVNRSEYNISTKVASTDPILDNKFTYVLPDFPLDLDTEPAVDSALITIETDTVSGASPYIFNISLRSVWGMNGMCADGSKASGFRSMVVAQFTGVSLQKDDRAFVKYNPSSRLYEGINIVPTKGTTLALESSSTNAATVYHLDSDAIYRKDWKTTHIKITNDAILQVVSVFAIGYANHFLSKSGGDASITNSNSNFGQLALVSDGFKKDAFKKDDNAFITHVITPKAIVTEDEEIEWLQFDVNKTKTVNNNARLYLLGYDSEDIKPPSLTQGFRIGARDNDKLYLNIDNTIFEADIKMSDALASSARRTVNVTSIQGSTGIFTSSGAHNFTTGEKVIVIADDGDLPEKIIEHRVYFIVQGDVTSKFKLALSKSDADNAVTIKNTFIADATNIKVISRVTDKESGDVGHPVQYDSTYGWYINTSNSDVTGGIFKGISDLSEESTDISFVKRITDTRSLDDKIFKTRVSISREVQNGKNIQNGFVLQESSSTNVRTLSDLNIGSGDILTKSDHDFNRNLRFISSCTFNSGTVTVVSERPHNLQKDDLVKIEGIIDSNNTDGTFNKGYNIEAKVDVVDNMTFKYSASGISNNPLNNFNIQKANVSTASSLPRFTRKDIQSNFYFYRNDIISEYDEGVESGVYHGYQLFADLSVPNEFTDSKYSQSVVDLYPQLDRDNINDTPRAAKSFGFRSPLGKVATNDLQKSITKESIDKLLLKFGSVIAITGFSDSTDTLTLERNHNLCGITLGGLNKLSNNTGILSIADGVYENIKIYDGDVSSNIWRGTLAKVNITSNAISAYEITNPGSGFEESTTEYGYFDSILGGPTNSTGVRLGSTTSVGLTNDNLSSSHENLVIQVTGDGNKSDSYFRTTSIPGPNQISIAKTAGDPTITSDQYIFIVGSALIVSVSGSTVTSTTPHGLKKGNRFQFNDNSNNNLGTFIVSSVTSTTTFTFDKGDATITSSGYILKHGLSANDADTGKNGENLSVRGVPLYGLEEGQLNEAIDAEITQISFNLFGTKKGIGVRFPQGSYIQIDDEILRIASFTNNAADGNLSAITVIRGVFGTRASSHLTNSLVIKLSPIPLELHRPSILRASGHTFEYLGYGPGNYSTALPQVQVKTLTEREEFLSQSQETSAGQVVYTGMNDKGDFYIGNQKKSSLTGEETTFDNPVPTIAGEDPSRLSVVFDEVTIKERLVVEGGRNNNTLSQFDGPVNYNRDVRFGRESRVIIKNNKSESAGGALSVDGGVSVGGTGNFNSVKIQKDLRVGIGSTDGEEFDAIILGQRKHIVFDNKSEIEDVNDGFRIFVNEPQTAVIKNETRRRDADGNVLLDEEGRILGRDISIMTRANSSINFGTNGNANTASFVADGSAILKYAGPVSGEGTTGTKLKTIGAGVTVTGQIDFNSEPQDSNAILLPAGRRIGMGTESNFQIFENVLDDGSPGVARIKHQGANDMSITVRENQNILISANTGASPSAQFKIGGEVNLYHNGSRKFRTTGVGVTIAGQIDFNSGDTDAILLPQGRKLAMGSDNKFKIFENANDNGTIKHEKTGSDIAITVTDGSNIKFGANGKTNLASFKAGEGCLFKYNNINRLETTSSGVTITGQLDVSGDIVAFASDERLKTNISPITEALSKVKSIDGFTYNFNDTAKELGFNTEIDYAGVSAQKVQKVLPEVVRPAPSGGDYITVQYEKLVPLLIEAIKELSDKVDYLEQKLSDK